MIIIEWFQAIWEFISWILKKTKLEKAEDLLEVINGFIKLCFTLLLSIIVYYLIFDPAFFIFNHYRNLSWGLVRENINGETLFISFVDLILFLSLLLFNAKIKKIEKINVFLSQHFETRLKNIYSELLSTQSLIHHDFKESYKYFSEWFREKTSYDDFIKSFQKTTKIEQEDLNTIAKESKESEHGRYSCVISYKEYFKDLNSVKKMVGYFASFYESVNENLNHIERIFTVQGDYDNANGLCKISLESESLKNYFVLLYLIINAVCSVDTYLLIYDKNSAEMYKKFFLKSDYVIAYPSTGKGRNEIELFFAFPKDDEDSDDKALRTKDTFFVQMFEKEFKNRMDLSLKDLTKTTFIKFNYQNISKVLLMLNIDVTDKASKKKVNIYIGKLLIWVMQNQQISQVEKQILKREIKKWKII